MNRMCRWMAVVVLVLTACTKNTAPPAPKVTQQDYGRLPFVVQDNYTYSMYYQGLEASGYSDTLAQEAGPFTILVPNNDAMTASSFIYNNGVNYFLQAFNPSLKDYVRYMIIPQKVSFSSLPIGSNQKFATLEGTPVYVSKYLSSGDTVITVNGIQVVASDVPATNGLIDVLSGVPEPQIYTNLWQRIRADATLMLFAAAIQRAGLVSLFEDSSQALTVLAPSNYAFATSYAGGGYPDLTSADSIMLADPALVKNIVMYHILSGRWFVNDFIRADTLAPDSVKLMMDNREVMSYTGGMFYSVGQVPALEAVYVNGYYVQEHVGPLAPVPAGFYSEFELDQPRVAYTDRPTGNGILQEISSLMAP